MLRSLPILAVVALLAGCAPNARMIDTKTIHNNDASRLWIVHESGGDQHIVLCDVAMLQQTHQLCIRWPGP